jgi:hypothetical protein
MSKHLFTKNRFTRRAALSAAILLSSVLALQSIAPHAQAIAAYGGAGGGSGPYTPCNVSNGPETKPAGAVFAFDFRLCLSGTNTVVNLPNQHLTFDPTADGFFFGGGGALALLDSSGVPIQNFQAYSPGSTTPSVTVSFTSQGPKGGEYKYLLQTKSGMPRGNYQLYVADPYGVEYWVNLTVK